MPLIRPFAGLRPQPERAEDVVAPPYDVLNSEEARQRAFAGAGLGCPVAEITPVAGISDQGCGHDG